MCFSLGRDNYAFVTFFEHSSAAEAIESEFKNAYCTLQVCIDKLIYICCCDCFCQGAMKIPIFLYWTFVLVEEESFVVEAMLTLVSNGWGCICMS